MQKSVHVNLYTYEPQVVGPQKDVQIQTRKKSMKFQGSGLKNAIMVKQSRQSMQIIKNAEEYLSYGKEISYQINSFNTGEE